MLRNSSFELRVESAKLLAARRLVELLHADDDTIVIVDVVRLDDIELHVSDLGNEDVAENFTAAVAAAPP